MLSERRMHAATMVPVTAAFLAGVAGLFVATGTTAGDRRLTLAGLPARHVFGARLAVTALATVVTTGAAIAVSGAWYPPRQWMVFTAASLLIAARSEEHTSELQSLMRISYAVFCLKKKKHTTIHNHTT